MRLIFEQILVGGDRNFGYLIGDGTSKQAALVDPCYRPELLVQRAKDQGLQVGTIINTHGHGDHTNGNNTAQELTEANIAAHKDSSVASDIKLEDGQELSLGEITLRILHTPGHSPDHLVIYIPEFMAAITGDHLFVGKVGGTWSESNARQQYNSLLKLFQELPEQTTVWPGHHVGCRPSSTLAMEKVSNPFILAKDFDAFYRLKQTWATFKADHGLL
ncbi:MAG: hydroxyacylglutathione hydrolase family protein [Waddliaceae bacterium]